MMCSLGRFLEAQMSESSVIIQSTVIRIHLLERTVAGSIETGSHGRFAQSSVRGFGTEMLNVVLGDTWQPVANTCVICESVI